jgi:hypothetical protein
MNVPSSFPTWRVIAVPMISPAAVFRSLVVVAPLAGLACIVIPIIEKGSCDSVQIAFWGFTGVLVLIYSIGLFNYNRWARLFCLVSAFFVLLPTPGEPQSSTWLRRYFYDLSVFCSGAILAMAYFSSVKDRFAPFSAEHNAATPARQLDI